MGEGEESKRREGKDEQRETAERGGNVGQRKTTKRTKNKGNYFPKFLKIPTIVAHTLELIEPMLLLRCTK